MSDFTGWLACVRCGAEVDASAPWTGCARCAKDGITANVLPTYASAAADAVQPDAAQPGIFRYRRRLPLGDDVVPVSLEEGDTPLVDAGRLAEELGVGALWFKDESRNPTWSYKDRLAAVAVTEARTRGADTVALATTGNHGAATAAYAARAGLRCVALTLTSVPSTMKVLMQSYGAHVLALESGPERWELLRQAVQKRGWVPISGFVDPPVGSNPFGIDGYKTIAYEIVEDLAAVPDVVVIPVAYADGLVGMQRGFAELVELGVTDRQPRMVAVDPFGAYEAALAAGSDQLPRVPVGPTVSFSIGTPIATYQGLAAVRASEGLAVRARDDEQVMAAQRRVGASCGIFLEAASATTVVAVEQLAAEGKLDLDSGVVCVATSTGLKDIGAAEARLPKIPVIGPRLDELDRALEAPGTA